MLQPLHDTVLVKPDKQEEKIGSLYVPDKHKEAPTKGTVIGAGKGRWEKDTFVPNPVKEGDRIMFVAYSGLETEYEGEKYLLIKQANIFGIIE